MWRPELYWAWLFWPWDKFTPATDKSAVCGSLPNWNTFLCLMFSEQQCNCFTGQGLNKCCLFNAWVWTILHFDKISLKPTPPCSSEKWRTCIALQRSMIIIITITFWQTILNKSLPSFDKSKTNTNHTKKILAQQYHSFPITARDYVISLCSQIFTSLNLLLSQRLQLQRQSYFSTCPTDASPVSASTPLWWTRCEGGRHSSWTQPLRTPESLVGL